MEQLFAPWRMEYVGGTPEAGCLFCRVEQAAAENDTANLVVWRAPAALVMMNRFPYNNGHLMVAPLVHVDDLGLLDDEQALGLMKAVQRSLGVLRGLMNPDGFNVGINLGSAAGAGIPDHVHVHIVPRWDGDTNFMAVLGEVKVINEHLERTREKLAAAFE